MPNIAFLGLIYLLLAVPGFLYRSLYHSGEFTRNLVPRSWTDEIGKAILYGAPFHLLGIVIIHYLQVFGITHRTLTMESVLRMMSGEYSTDGYSFHGISSRLYDNAAYAFCYYIGVLAAAFFAGRQARKLVWGKELDVKYPWLRYRSEWLYRIMGRGVLKGVSMKDTGAWIDVLSEQETKIPGKTMLYRGLAAGYTTKENGALRDIILTDVKRTSGETVDGKVKWTQIPGEFLVMSYSKVGNINITYEQHSKRLLKQIAELPTGLTPSAPVQPLKGDPASK
jgi:hypothetical protein